MVRRFVVCVFVLMALALGAAAQSAQVMCTQTVLTDNDNEQGTILSTGPFSSPWSAWLVARGGSSFGSVVVKGYGPCLTNDDPATCVRGSASTLATLSSGTLTARADGPVPAWSASASDACTTTTCVGGANEGAACGVASICPGGACGPCKRYVSFCGVSPSGLQ